MPAKKEKAGKGGVIPPKKTRFSKTNQPSPQAKSKGVRDWHNRRRLLDNLAAKFAEKTQFVYKNKLVEAPTFELLAIRLQEYFTTKAETKLSTNEAKTLLKFLELLGGKSVLVSGDENGAPVMMRWMQEAEKDGQKHD